MHRQALLNSQSGRLSMHSHALLQTTVGMKVWFILIISMRSAGPWEISAVKQGSGWAFLIQPPYKTAEGQQQCGSIGQELLLQLQQLSLHLLHVGQTRQTTLLRVTDVWFWILQDSAAWKEGCLSHSNSISLQARNQRWFNRAFSWLMWKMRTTLSQPEHLN